MTWWRPGKMLSFFLSQFHPSHVEDVTFPIHTRKWNMRLCFMLNIYMSDACSNTLLQVSVPKLGSRNIAYNGQSVSPLSPQQNDQQYQCNYINLRRVLHTGNLGKGNLSPHHRRFKGCSIPRSKVESHGHIYGYYHSKPVDDIQSMKLSLGNIVIWPGYI